MDQGPGTAVHTSTLERSGIRAVMDAAWALTEPFIGLHVGEPGHPTPGHVIEAMTRALAAGDVRYAPNRGTPELREALAAKLAARNGILAGPEEIVVTAGGMQAVHLALTAVISAGDEVLIPDPGWPNYALATRMLQGTAVRYPLRAENGFLPDPADLAAAVTPRTRVLVVNSPANPLGTVLPAERVAELLAFAERNGLWLLADECYEDFVFDGAHVSPAALDRGRVLGCFSFSKSYAMTGLRVGYLLAPRVLADICAQAQEAIVACVNTPAQAAALAALTGPRDHLARMNADLVRRRTVATDLLDRGQVTYLRPEGAFYLMVRVAAAESEGRPFDDTAWALDLLRRRSVAVVPGSAFGPGGRGWVRTSLAVDDAQLLKGLTRLMRHL